MTSLSIDHIVVAVVVAAATALAVQLLFRLPLWRKRAAAAAELRAVRASLDALPGPRHIRDFDAEPTYPLEPAPPLQGDSLFEADGVTPNPAATTPLLSRIESACIVVTLGAKETGFGTKRALRHPSVDLRSSRCNKDAAEILFLTLAALLKAAPPEVSDRLSRDAAEYRYSADGLIPARPREVSGPASSEPLVAVLARVRAAFAAELREKFSRPG
ncbi:hypothetical protein [Cupriavidus basilensis]|uniref:hypothetical protein n=1 Tax=Cupriavidus basilensis TaxID=68895 RepID=UPI0023E7E66D|nr:hypothetical protein [Cupriavidus basilensis]